MASLTYREVVKILTDNGCCFVARAKDSHEKWFSPITSRKFIVPRSMSGEGTMRGVFKAAGVHYP